MEASALQAPAVGITRITLTPRLLRLRSDDQLVALFRAGNDDAFGVIHDRYRQRLFAYCRQMVASRPDAEDALQDVFIRAYSALRATDRPIALKAWLYRVAHNRCVDHLRRPLPPAAEVFELARGPLPDPLAEAERRDDLRRLVADVRRLPTQQRSVLLMRELEGLSYADLAETLGVTVPAVKSLLVRARMGLVEAAEARETACADIRHDLALAHGRGVRANARARRHLRDCPGCRAYRQDMRRVQRSLAALAPAGAGPLGLLSKLGLGGSGGGSGAAGSGAVGSGIASTGSGAGLAGGGAAAAGGGTGTGLAGGGVAAGSGLAAGGGTAGSGAAMTASGLATGGLAAGGVAGGGGLVAGVSGGAAALTAGKVAAVVSAMVVAGGGAAAVEENLTSDPAKVAPTPVAVQPVAPVEPAAAPTPLTPPTVAEPAAQQTQTATGTDASSHAVGSADTGTSSADDAQDNGSGGLAAPSDAASGTSLKLDKTPAGSSSAPPSTTSPLTSLVAPRAPGASSQQTSPSSDSGSGSASGTGGTSP